ncbi:MAG TPA: alpha-galactosidase, partial [Ignavibacteriaceae bacterium]|nr:alpha-galactosidase [Ignavibacteriaceae bacterium]
MNDSIKRREFIKSVSLFGASIAIANPFSAGAFISGNDNGEIKNDYFTVSFDKSRGTFNILRNSGTPLLIGGTSCANSNAGKRCIASEFYHNTLDSAVFKDQLGRGEKLIVHSRDIENKLDFEIYLSLYEQLQAVTIEAICKNVSGHDVVINSLEPVRVIKDKGGMLNIPGVAKCITNGEMYYDVGMIYEFETNKKLEPSGGIQGIKLSNKSLSSQKETIHSWWNVGLFSGYDKEGIVLGYLDNNSGLGNLLISRTGPDQVSFIAESVYMPELILKSGKTISSNRFMINIAGNPYTSLEDYADAAGRLNKARPHSIVNGWCSWFYTLAQVSENEVIANTEFASEHLKKFGLEYVQIDEGYQRWHGDWEGNERFPHGMKWLAEKIKSYGFNPGLWISPYVISETTDVFRKHPDWLLKRLDGTLKRIGNWEGE